MAEITYETKIDFGNFCGNKKLTFTSWNDGEFKYDIRDWYDNGSCGKGITLTLEELKTLYELISELDESAFETKEVIPEIQEKFDELDKLFKGFKTERKYGVMEFAKKAGERFQYKVKKGKKALPDYEKVVEKLGLKSFITDKGNLFIYTL
jgi:hypothetical protein